jgi:cytochrome b
MQRMRVWDLPTRLFHWLAVALVLAAYATWRWNWMVLHAWAGETLLALVFFRLLWGVYGSDTSRFSRFVATPVAALRHLARAFRREPDRQVGHNPAGGWMVLLLLALLLGETLSGLYVNNDVAVEGPLTELVPARIADLITDLHSILWYALLAAMTLHVAAIVVYAAVMRHHLTLPMVTGLKQLPDAMTPPRFAGLARALLLLGLSAAAAALLAVYG